MSSLDVSLKGQIVNLLKDLRDTLHVRYACITHDLATVPYLCDRVYVLYRGLIFEQPQSAVLASDAKNPYTRMLADSVLSIDKRRLLDSRKSTVDRLHLVPRPACPLSPKCPLAADECRETFPSLHRVAPG